MIPSPASPSKPPETGIVWQAWCDGTAAPNPGKLSAGGVIVSPDGKQFEFSQALGCSGCNNEAELRALLLTLDLAHRAKADHLHIFSDSRFVVDCVNGLDRTDIPRLSALLDQISKRVTGFKTIELRWLPRQRNAAADRLARAALGLLEKTPKIKKRRK